jgi:hypothetical protein
MKSFGSLLVFVIPLSTVIAGQPTVPQKNGLERVVFEQYCFWTGEMKLGQIDGVVRTEAGFFQGHEVTLVDFDQTRVSLEQLARRAREGGVGDRLHLPAGSRFTGTSIGGVPLGGALDGRYRPAPASDQKKQIQGTAFARLDLTPEEATKVNAFVRSDPRKALESLGPKQRAQLAAIQ